MYVYVRIESHTFSKYLLAHRHSTQPPSHRVYRVRHPTTPKTQHTATQQHSQTLTTMQTQPQSQRPNHTHPPTHSHPQVTHATVGSGFVTSQGTQTEGTRACLNKSLVASAQSLARSESKRD